MSNNNFSKLGFILAAAGSAIGLGNIWRFPYLMASYGGSTFVVLYFIFAFTIGLVLMTAEFTIGRHLGSPITESMKTKLKHGGLITKLTYIFPFIAFVILSYYFVVAGWGLFYFTGSITNVFNYSSHMGDSDYFASVFIGLLGSPFKLILFSIIFILITVYINYKGIEKGIEKVSNFFLPALFVLMLGLIIRVLFLDGATEGLKYFVQFDPSKITWEVVFAALGQMFFSLSLGMGVLMVYASHTPKDANLFGSARSTVLLGSGIALFSSSLIIPAVFAFGYDLNSGAGLAFITLPNVFSNIPLGFIFASLFFFVLSVAALTSTISLVECIIPYTQRLLKVSRNQALLIATVLFIVFSTIQALSFGVLSNIKILNMPLFDFFADFFTNVLFIFSTLLTCFIFGFAANTKELQTEITNQGKLKFTIFNPWLFSIRYIVPVISLAIIINTLYVVLKG